jgi:hypothetical protein
MNLGIANSTELGKQYILFLLSFLSLSESELRLIKYYW